MRCACTEKRLSGRYKSWSSKIRATFHNCYEFPSTDFRPLIAQATAPHILTLHFLQPMQTGNSILIRAPLETIFETAADLEQWPRILPHYRYIHFLSRQSDRCVVEMAAKRSGIPISWTSELVVDRHRMELRFLHLKAFTRGMRVVWSFKETPMGVVVEITHSLRFRIPTLAPVAEPIIGHFFIHHVANQTLRAMKAHLEKQAVAVPNPVRVNGGRS